MNRRRREDITKQRQVPRSIYGSPDTVRSGIEALIAEPGADELMIVSDVYDHHARLRSFELIAGTQAAGTVEELSTVP